jgi:hypothetical protein
MSVIFCHSASFFTASFAEKVKKVGFSMQNKRVDTKTNLKVFNVLKSAKLTTSINNFLFSTKLISKKPGSMQQNNFLLTQLKNLYDLKAARVARLLC